ncbi:MAG: arginine--tRNA ligase [Xanthomonadales bacterium]|nr:arginine--tRNA ligase [Xanthomonadales bacterium]
MKEHLRELVQQALMDLRRERQWAIPDDYAFAIDRTRHKEHGDFACNVALLLAKPLGRSPVEIAQAIVETLLPSRHVAQVAVAKPGFINFRMSNSCLHGVVRQVLEMRDEYGTGERDSVESIIVEFLSANPTGPLHVGHGRGAAYGDSLCALLAARGASVHREYYVNDHGRQVDILAVSVWLRYLELVGVAVPFPERGYKGEYVYDIARELKRVVGDDLRRSVFEINADLPTDGSDEAGEKHIDALILRTRQLLGESYLRLYGAGLEAIVSDIREDLTAFGVQFDRWYYESSLAEHGRITQAIERLRVAGHIRVGDDGAHWFATSTLGDEKDRVVIRSNGQPTYFASDIAYLLDKFERGFDRAIYVLAADHHGYVARLRAAARGLAIADDRLEILLVQPASLHRGEERLPMSTRSGEFVSLRSLREEVGTDACRYFYVMHDHAQPLDFDLQLALEESKDNPVYYIQYAHARIAGVFRGLQERHLSHNVSAGDAARNLLLHPSELELMDELMRFPEIVAVAAEARAPHWVASYLRDLAHSVHSYYDGSAVRVLCDEEDLRNARLNLLRSAQQVIANGLALLGVKSPERL